MGKLLFIFCLGQGHMNVCVSVAKQLLDKYPEHEGKVDFLFLFQNQISCDL